jgi:hypothetical protein
LVSTSHLPSKRFARYGPLERYEASPKAGMCLSAFALVRRVRQKGVLFGLPKPDKRWLSDWMVSWHNYSSEELSKIYDEWRLPSSYLLEGDHPLDSIRRIMGEQLGIKKYEVSGSPMVFSYTSPSSWYPGNNHWDLAFVYSVSINSRKDDDIADNQVSRSLWRELRFFESKKQLRSKDFGWNDDLIQDLGLI